MLMNEEHHQDHAKHYAKLRADIFRIMESMRSRLMDFDITPPQQTQEEIQQEAAGRRGFQDKGRGRGEEEVVELGYGVWGIGFGV